MDINQKERRDIVLRIADYYNSTDRYIYSERHSNAHQAVFTKKKDRYRWLVLEQKSQDTIEARQTAPIKSRHGTVTYL